MSGNGDDLFIGFDFSTQQLKATVLDDKLNLLFEESVVFDQELPEFRWFIFFYFYISFFYNENKI